MVMLDVSSFIVSFAQSTHGCIVFLVVFRSLRLWKFLENFKAFDDWTVLTKFKDTINNNNISKNEKLEIIRNEFRKISPKDENYDKYVEQSKDQQEYEEYILNIWLRMVS